MTRTARSEASWAANLRLADEIERLRAELAAEREWKRANIELAEQLITVTAGRDALRALLREARERLAFYANSQVYEPDATGRVGDLTYSARSEIARIDAALEGKQ